MFQDNIMCSHIPYTSFSVKCCPEYDENTSWFTTGPSGFTNNNVLPEYDNYYTIFLQLTVKSNNKYTLITCGNLETQSLVILTTVLIVYNLSRTK